MEKGTLFTAVSKYQRRSPALISEGRPVCFPRQVKEAQSVLRREVTRLQWKRCLLPRGPSESEHVFVLGTCSL